jgi:hypothetical protein
VSSKQKQLPREVKAQIDLRNPVPNSSGSPSPVATLTLGSAAATTTKANSAVTGNSFAFASAENFGVLPLFRTTRLLRSSVQRWRTDSDGPAWMDKSSKRAIRTL